jgi:uncharacterized damage-inducible protein DinB
MKKLAIALAIAMATCAGSAIAQTKTPATTMSGVLNKSLSDVEGEFVPAADAMPEAQYKFAPSESMGEFKGVRTYADQVNHVAAVNYIVGAAILGEKPPVELNGEGAPKNVQSKAYSIKFLKDSFAYAHKALDSLTDANAFGLVQLPWGPDKVSRASLAVIMISHPFDHYGQMVEYLRMNKIVPPASRKQSQ